MKDCLQCMRTANHFLFQEFNPYCCLYLGIILCFRCPHLTQLDSPYTGAMHGLIVPLFVGECNACRRAHPWDDQTGPDIWESW